jgi:hypothetical protein
MCPVDLDSTIYFQSILAHPMVSNTKIERAARGPGVVEIVISILLSLILGIFLGLLHLTMKPVLVVKALPADTIRGQVYFIEGTNSSGKSRQWTRKRQMLAEGGPIDIVFNQDELNAWISSVLPNMVARPGAPQESISMTTPNFRIHDDKLQFGVALKISFFGVEIPTAVQVRGHFVQSENGPQYIAEELFLGSLPFHKIPGYSGHEVQKAVWERPDIPEDVKKSLAGLSMVKIEGDALRVVRQ